MRLIDTIDLPVWAVTYLEYGDASALTEADETEVDNWQNAMIAAHGELTFNYAGLGSPYFHPSPEFGLAGDCVRCEVYAQGPDLSVVEGLALAALRLIESGGPYDDTIRTLSTLAEGIHGYTGEGEDMWDLDLNYSDGLPDIIVASYWHLTQWHGGQTSDTYAALCALGQVFTPGCAIEPVDGDSEFFLFEALAAMAGGDS